MFEPLSSLRFAPAPLGLAFLFFFALAAPAAECQGQYGGDLSFLRRCHTAPAHRDASNHYFDLWSPGSLPALARAQGLTNNRALFVDSHGKAGRSVEGDGFVLYPSDEMVPSGLKAPCFSARDLATVLGPQAAAHIHNILIAGCNEEGRLSAAEFRQYFPKATNITHIPAGRLAYKPMFYQAIALHSRDVKPLFGKTRPMNGGRVECDISSEPARGASELGAFVAQLFLPGASKPYQQQKAGRELLQPAWRPGMTLRTQPPARLNAQNSVNPLTVPVRCEPAGRLKEAGSPTKAAAPAPVRKAASIVITKERTLASSVPRSALALAQSIR